MTEVLKYYPGVKSDKYEWLYEPDDRLIACDKRRGSWWWLRSPGGSPYRAAGVITGGSVDLGGYTVYDELGVRPALWLNL